MLRRSAPLLALALLAALFTAPASADHAGPAPGPTAAYNTYGWWQHGSLRWREEFHGALGSDWKASGAGLRHGGNVRNQNGMLTLNTGDRGTVRATLKRGGAAYGRWETRLRLRRYGNAADNYSVVTELVPEVGRNQWCGARNVALEKYRIRWNAVRTYARTRKDNEFRDKHPLRIGNDEWHTFGVEITPDRITWFIDAHIVGIEERPEAISGTPLTIRFKMQAQNGKQMNRSRMQMDWVRSWNLNGTRGEASEPNAHDRNEGISTPSAGTYPLGLQLGGGALPLSLTSHRAESWFRPAPA
ncbi:hypothetical protein KUV85_09920 [Nocardioides panacisoli]|uniref:hypothetical protein n=1 Tax=Nocardioides panacisoli TaxID=627624 RepID=UPI001C62EF04|nr:hypothetical protein [Nocardioides panacisoli]QYJ02657.1 hypothetical protein KUV85_09920 [Nocardioides panacisoli]